MNSPGLNPVVQESMALLAMLLQIDDMVNYAIFEPFEKRFDTNLMFRNHASRRLFNILLVDFLSLPSQKGPLRLSTLEGASAGVTCPH